MKDFIKIRGARVHNLKNISLDIPKNKLVVVTGISGSGKSSLAFDTIYAEGQRRYVESLSAYARQFLGVMDKPDVDSIEGLSPAISIDQKSVSRNPRSTVGTITEIHDYLRLLFARVGVPHCPQCGRKVSRQSSSQITDQILKLPAGTKFTILAPIIKDQKGEHKEAIKRFFDSGYARLRVDGVIVEKEQAEKLSLARYKRHSIEVVVDRATVEAKRDKDERARINESVEQALRLSDGVVVIAFAGSAKEDLIFSESLACLYCGINLPEIEPRTFSFNSPHGACPACSGLGYTQEIDPDLVIPNKNLTLAEGAIKPWATASHRVGRQGWYWYLLEDLSEEVGFSLNTPVKKLDPEIIDLILYGPESKKLPTTNYQLPTTHEGVAPNLMRRYRETESDYTRKEIEQYMVERPCPACQGKRLRPEALAVKVAGKTIDWVSNISIEEANRFFRGFFSESKGSSLGKAAQSIAKPIVKEINERLGFLLNVGLAYLTLDRGARTLSGGESQRIRLATQLGSGLTGVLYILDEPSIGLHQRDQARLIKTVKGLRDLGNTVVVVEHDEQTIEEADWVIDVGPGAGRHGGQVIFEGAPRELRKSRTLTGDYLSGRRKIEIRDDSRKNSGSISEEIVIKGASQHNLKNINVEIPLGRFVCITGVSGSGKSTLVDDTLARYLEQHFYSRRTPVGRHREILGTENLDKVIVVDQSPIGRTPRSNPATYTGLFSPIRELFAQTREARLRGYKAGRFSFNVKGGRCEVCEGQGLKKIEMHFLPDLYVECEECHGSRYNREALEIFYKEKNIAEVLKMSIEEAHEFFKHIPPIERRLKTLLDVGLSYMELGQPATTLSGGEAQRVKLATELARQDTGRTLYILDEPTVGLHFDDVQKLLNVLHSLRQKGDSGLDYRSWSRGRRCGWICCRRWHPSRYREKQTKLHRPFSQKENPRDLTFVELLC